jgi:hypothetical protein
MPLTLSITIGFTTNSSAYILGYPKRILEDPEVKAFMDRYDLWGGYSCSDLSRNNSAIAMTQEQKAMLLPEEPSEDEDDGYYGHIKFNPKDADEFIVFYGDEYSSMASELAHILSEASRRLGAEGWEHDVH